MILPIRAIGDPVLKRKARDIQPDEEGLSELIDNMFETMYNAQGIGLAAPQIGKDLRMFIVDTNVAFDDDDKEEKEEEDEEGIKEVFINPEIVEFLGDDSSFEEGCLSIPNIREEVIRPEGVHVKYRNRNFEEREVEVGGLLARVFQHEFDHIDGILFTDHLTGLKKRLLKSKLERISKGKVEVPYPMRFPGI